MQLQSGSGAPSPAERSRSLATAVALCTFCPSEIDWAAEVLRAPYLHLGSLRPVPHAAHNDGPPTPFKERGGVHGSGASNG